MKVVLYRTNYGLHFTAGRLYVDDKYFSDTLEPAESIHEPYFAAHPCIPVGTYELAITFSARLHRFLPLVMDVPSRSGIRVHPLNRASESLGCIGLGTCPIDDDSIIQNSKEAVRDFQAELEFNLPHGKVFLTITVDPCPVPTIP